MLSVRGVGTLLVVAVALVCHAIGVTLPDGFYIDESKFVAQTSRAAGIGGKCSRANITECSDDCTSLLTCDKNGIVTSSAKCNSQYYSMYCVKKGYQDDCSLNFPINNQQCFNYAYNNFECTGDGLFPDPTDGTKYHECSGTTHTIRECEGNYRFWYDAKSLSEPTTNGNFTCRYFNEQTCQSSFPSFICQNSPNTYTFRSGDMHYYAYCMTLATTSKILVFRCPAGTVHNSKMNAEKQVVCAPPV